MKKETKYALLSIPFTYLSLVIISLIMMYKNYVLYGACADAGVFSTLHPCSLTEFFSAGFTSGFLFSIYFAPIYIIVALITYFTNKNKRIANESNSTSATIPNKNRVKWIILVISLFLVWRLWSSSVGLSIETIPQVILGFFNSEQKNVGDSTSIDNKQTISIENWISYKNKMGYEIKYPPKYNVEEINTKITILETKEYVPGLDNVVIHYFENVSEFERYKENYKKTYYYYPYNKTFNNNGHYYEISFPDISIDKSISLEEQEILNSFKFIQ